MEYMISLGLRFFSHVSRSTLGSQSEILFRNRWERRSPLYTAVGALEYRHLRILSITPQDSPGNMKEHIATKKKYPNHANGRGYKFLGDEEIDAPNAALVWSQKVNCIYEMCGLRSWGYAFGTRIVWRLAALCFSIPEIYLMPPWVGLTGRG